MAPNPEAYDLSGVPGCRAAAERLLSDQTRRWRHVCGVAGLAAELADAFGLATARRSLLLRAAWLHDIGYAPALRETGFHPLDGALWIRTQGEETLARLVARHSAAFAEARVRGLSLDEFPSAGGVAPLLDYADICTDPDGQRVTPSARLAEVLDRYPTGTPAHEALRISCSGRLARAARLEARMAALTAKRDSRGLRRAGRGRNGAAQREDVPRDGGRGDHGGP